jgi:hypothetical protein
MDTLAHIVDKYKLTIGRRMPVEIPNTGRAQLAEVFCELDFRFGVEVGVETGVFSEVLCKANPELTLFCVDAWEPYRGYRDHTDKDEMNGCYEQAVKRLGKYKAALIRKFSLDACGNFPDNYLDFVYIDANHEWPYITQDIYYWSKKVRQGGIISGHDYYKSNKHDKCHVKGAVGGYTYAFNISPWFLLGTRARVPGQIRETSRSWFWVKA